MLRLFQALLAIVGLGLAQWTLAEVRLSTSVHRVESWIAEGGGLETEYTDAALAAAGDELRYTITFTNTGLVPVDPGAIVITNPIRRPPNTSGTRQAASMRAFSSTPAPPLKHLLTAP